eukprot:gnl/TRDRNA2_/TRDRNA2_172244_c5_seq4.p1 gnl/TRDRNA2_/TRDRNA2_172244_c5~~gnl/TRDRNA2_/TRDRNA2_172244_c5_seq4.p1  ORF type:complete len:167 (+),score=23.14 gnl/TRDRNA2_/TRDRNA2_172244_c5_seq4:384-884(+)
MQEGWDAQQPRLQHMVRVVSLLQQMKLFGCHFWLGRQIFTVPYDKRSFLDDAPSAVLKINPASSDAEYWICVDTFGIRFAAIADEWSRGFLFSEESTDRVYRWGAKQNVLQLLVHAHNPALPYAGVFDLYLLHLLIVPGTHAPLLHVTAKFRLRSFNSKFARDHST